MPELVTPALLRDWPLPLSEGSKTARGTALVIGGARPTPGAAMLAGRAALRVGAGRLSLAVAASVAGMVAVALPECGAYSLAEDRAGSVTGSDPYGALDKELPRAHAVLIGPGLDDPDGAARLVEAVAEHTDDRVPVLLDAFALGVLPAAATKVRRALAGRLVLTPNAGELARLLEVREIGDDDVDGAVRDVARRYDAVVTAKGRVAAGDDMWRETAGDTGLGTSGSGDVLAGAITGLLARGADPAQAAVWGTHVHAAAGDTLAARIGRVGFLASELIDELPYQLDSLRGM